MHGKLVTTNWYLRMHSGISVAHDLRYNRHSVTFALTMRRQAGTARARALFYPNDEHGIPMNLRSPLLASAMMALSLLAGCTAYSNRETCLDRMRTSYNEVAQLPLKISNVSVATQGSRIVVEATVKAPHLPKAAPAAPGSAALVLPASAATSIAAPASASNAVSATVVQKIPPGNAAAECTFDGRQLTHFHWLTPVGMVTPGDPS